MEIVVISMQKELCTGCGSCSDNCPNRVFEIVEGKARVVNAKACMACYLCETVCPQMGIKIVVERADP